MKLAAVASASLAVASAALNAVLAPQKVVAAAPAAVAPAFGSVSDCTSSGALAQNFKVSTNTSDSVSVGDFVALVFDYDLTVVVNDGSQYYNCTVNGFLPYNTVDDLCAAQANSPDPCPLGVGHHTDTGVIEVPSGVTKMKCTIQWTTGAGDEILCATAQWDVSAAAAAADAEAIPAPAVVHA